MKLNTKPSLLSLAHAKVQASVRASSHMIAASAIASAAFWLPAAHAAQMLDHIVAVVDEDVILASELDQATDAIKSQIRASGQTPPPESALREQVRERLIVQRIQAQRAAQRGISVTDEELNETLRNVAARNNMSLRDFALALRNEGMDYLAVREQIREEILINQLRAREVEARIVVSDRDVEDFLSNSEVGDDNTEYRIQHILIAVPEGATPTGKAEARAEAEQIVAALRDGADFSQLAISRSDGQRALEGGDLGYRTQAAMPTIFSAALPRLNVGDNSDVLESSSGFHVIRLADKKGANDAPQILKETKARHILLQANALRTDAEAADELADIRARILAGEDFAELAREFSDDPGSANQGGELGYQVAGSFVPAFEVKMESLEIGELSEPFKSRFGWHILEVLDRRERDGAEQIRLAQARQAIRERKLVEDTESWIRRMRDEAFVELREAPDSNAIDRALDASSDS